MKRLLCALVLALAWDVGSAGATTYTFYATSKDPDYVTDFSFVWNDLDGDLAFSDSVASSEYGGAFTGFTFDNRLFFEDIRGFDTFVCNTLPDTSCYAPDITKSSWFVFSSQVGGTSGFSGNNWVYTYQRVDPIPLPASSYLMLAGLAGLGWVARRRNPADA